MFAADSALELELLCVPKVRESDAVSFIHVVVAVSAMKLERLQFVNVMVLDSITWHGYARRIPWCLTCKYNMGVGFHLVICGVPLIKIDCRPTRVKGDTLSIADYNAHLTGGVRFVWVVVQLETVMMNLIGVDEAMVKAMAALTLAMLICAMRAVMN